MRNKAVQALAQLCAHMPQAGSAPHAVKPAQILLEAALPHLLALLSGPDAKTGKQVCSVGNPALHFRRQAGQQSTLHSSCAQQRLKFVLPPIAGRR